MDAAERADAALAAGDPEGAWSAAAACVEIAGGGFLAGDEAPWAQDRRREVAELRLRALEAMAAAGVALGGSRLADAERAAREAIEAAPFRESGHRLLMAALAGRGNVAEALRAYDDLRVLLRDELGTAPGADVQALHRRLLDPTSHPGRKRRSRRRRRARREGASASGASSRGGRVGSSRRRCSASTSAPGAVPSSSRSSTRRSS